MLCVYLLAARTAPTADELDAVLAIQFVEVVEKEEAEEPLKDVSHRLAPSPGSVLNN